MLPAVATLSGGASAGADGGAGRSYFQSSVTAYGLGLGLCFLVNYLSKSGQPGEKCFFYFFLVVISNPRSQAALMCSAKLAFLLARASIFCFRVRDEGVFDLVPMK